MSERLQRTAAYVRERVDVQPQVAIISGSGLAAVGRGLADETVTPYSDLPHFPKTGVLGHPGNLRLGKIGGVWVAVFEGRVHSYEGHPMQDVAYPAYLAAALQTEVLIVTNAAGGINPAFGAGDIMLISDHINLLTSNPLTGAAADQSAERFISMRDAYDPSLRAMARRSAAAQGFDVREGVYAATAGPMYETDAEIRMLGILGADAVGMSTVPEVIAARQRGMRVLGVSVIANRTARSPDDAAPLSHGEVLATVQRSAERVKSMLQGVIGMLGA